VEWAINLNGIMNVPEESLPGIAPRQATHCYMIIGPA
jgi:hypothetical protein